MSLWERTKEAAPVAFLSCIVLSVPAILFLVYQLLLDKYLRLPILLYLAWITFGPGRRAAGSGSWAPSGRRWRFWRGLGSYFPARLHKTADLDPGGRYIFGFHPHGLIGTSVWAGFATEATKFSELFPGIDLRLGTIRFNMTVPFGREFLLRHGFFVVERRNCLRLLEAPGRAILIVLGGAAEAPYTQRGCCDLVLRKRKGFVKLALKSGAALVPVLAFGENDLFHRPHTAPGSLADLLQQATKKLLGFTLPLAYGEGPFGLWLGLLPRQVPLDIVVGAPIEVPLFEGSLRSEEGRAAVERYHAAYVAALQELWDRHKGAFAPGRVRDLRIVE